MDEAFRDPPGPVGRIAAGVDDRLAFIGVVAIQFESDHDKKITNQGFHAAEEAADLANDYEPGGDPFPDDSTWKIDPFTGAAVSHPVSHTAGRKVTLKVTVRNDYSRAVKGRVIGHVVGADVADDMKFEASSQRFPPGETTISITSSEPLRNLIQFQTFRIRWTITGWGVSATTGMHMAHHAYAPVFESENELLITADEPLVTNDADLTYGRMAHAIKKTAAVASAATTSHAIVEALVKGTPFDGDLSSPKDPWVLARAPGQGADCITIASYVQAIIELLGVEGTTDAVIVYVRPKVPIPWKSVKPPDSRIIKGFPAPARVAKLRLLETIADGDFKVVEDSSPANPKLAGLNWPLIIHPTEPWGLRLIDSKNGINIYEGCVKFTDGTGTKWYPAGTGLSGQASPEDVIKNVFTKLSWVEGDTIRTTVETY